MPDKTPEQEVDSMERRTVPEPNSGCRKDAVKWLHAINCGCAGGRQYESRIEHFAGGIDPRCVAARLENGK